MVLRGTVSGTRSIPIPGGSCWSGRAGPAGGAATIRAPFHSSLSPALKLVREPRVYVVGRQAVDPQSVQEFLNDHGALWETDALAPGEKIAEAAGRICYMSFGKGRKSNRDYLTNILQSAHGSVLEHAVWNFIFTGVSRSLTHELIRHRAGFGYSQLSQRYVDESDSDFIEPDVIADDPKLHAIWVDAVNQSRKAYDQIVAGLVEKFASVESATLRRKMARQAARSVLPNATETKIFVTANARALRHFIELRGDEHADVEIRKLAVQICRLMQKEAPALFGDYTIRRLPDGSEATATEFRKV
ncbi:MAG: FAD-dependent thymidylate synthase [Planctomycetes bacterium]|nr:FAD-dependent thymidylate synthase [Planctomycetota bacterium]